MNATIQAIISEHSADLERLNEPPRDRLGYGIDLDFAGDDIDPRMRLVSGITTLRQWVRRTLRSDLGSAPDDLSWGHNLRTELHEDVTPTTLQERARSLEATLRLHEMIQDVEATYSYIGETLTVSVKVTPHNAESAFVEVYGLE